MLGTPTPDRLSALRRMGDHRKHQFFPPIEGNKLSNREVERLL